MYRNSLTITCHCLTLVGHAGPDGISLAWNRVSRDDVPHTLELKKHYAAQSKNEVSESLETNVKRDSDEFKQLVKCKDTDIVFKDEEKNGADRMMTEQLKKRLEKLADQVKTEWLGVKLRVTEAWDEDNEHSSGSLHYAGRAADITTSDIDKSKYGRLAGLAIKAKLDWVYYEDSSHVHVSVSE